MQYNTTLTLFWELSTQYLFGIENLSFPAFKTEMASQSWKFTQDECHYANQPLVNQYGMK
jgi:hypothetical protein